MNKAEKIVEQNNVQPSYEFNSYSDSLVNSVFYFGLNILEYFTQDQLASIIKDPMTYNDVLRHLSIMLYGTNGAYTNTVDYMCSLPTLSKVVIPHGKSQKKRNHNKDLMLSTLRTIRDKEFIRDALMKAMLEGAAYYYFETSEKLTYGRKMLTDIDIDSITEINELGVNAAIFSLPADYTRIVGKQNSSPVLAFNVDYFLEGRSGSEEDRLLKAPKEIRDAYKKKRMRSSEGGNWVVLDNRHTLTLKIKAKSDEPFGRPLVIAAINDILYGDYFTQTKRGVLDDLNNRVVYQTFPESKDKGVSSLTKTQQENQHNAVKGVVLGKTSKGGTSFVSVAAGTKLAALDVQNTDIFDEKNESNINDKIALDLGLAASLLNGVGSGSYSAQEQNLKLVSSQIFQWIEQLTYEINKVISSCIVKDQRNWCEVYYLPTTFVNQKEMVGYMKDLYTTVGGSMGAYIAACGIEPEAYYALLDEEYDNSIFEKYPPHPLSYTTSGNDLSPGRPRTDNPSENTVKSRANNGNAQPSPSDD